LITLHRAHRTRALRLATASLFVIGIASTGAPALADGGAGGTGGGAGGPGPGGPTNLTSGGGAGGDAQLDFGAGGGGGGAGTTGGSGGAGAEAGGVGMPPGGAGGASAGASGADGTSGNGPGNLGGGGGGGGAHGAVVTTTTTNSGAVTGGAGGAGGAGGGAVPVGGGGGGAGGYGVVVNGSALNYTNGSTVTGGAGGAGGAGDGPGSASGNGGDGGVGVQFTASGATLTNTGTVTGGNGGAGGVGTSGATDGAAGAGGAGIVGAGLTVINSGTISGGLSGSGVQANAVTFTGGANVLELQAGSSIIGNVVDQTGNGTFRLGGSTNSSFDVSTIGASAQYQGFASFAKTGSGTWTLSGTNTAVLPWSVNAGTLMVDGAIANSPMTVNAGGTLGGTGTVGNVTVANGGTFAPGAGAPGSTMAVSGNLAFQSGAAYLVQVNPMTVSSANVSGIATLTGATVNAQFASGSYLGKQYSILTATAGLGGTSFAGLTNTNLPAGFTDSLSYSGNSAILNLTAALGAGGGLNRNQQNVANTLNTFFNNGGALPPNFASIFGLTGSSLSNALTQASGESATGSQQATFDAMNLFMGVMTDPFIAGRGDGASAGTTTPGYAEEQGYGVSAYAPKDTPRSQSERDAYAAIYHKAPPMADPFTQRWSVWAAGYGGSQTTDGNAVLGSNSTTSSGAGTVVGADYRISPYTLAGFALAGGGTSFSVVGSGSGRSDLFQAGAFIRHTVGPAYISAALAYGWQDITTNRTVSVAGIDQLRAEFNANAFSGRVEGGYRFVSPWAGGIGLTPYAATQFTTFDLPAYAEQAVVGSNAFALAYNAKDVTDARSELGIRTDKSWAMPGAILTLRSRFAWAHDFDPDRSIGATFQTLPGASFVVNGAAQAHDSALTTASVEMKWVNGWSAAATFEGEFSNVTSSYAGKGVVRYAW
jgi:uncharacterized protein with beta-barrel porin domain